MPNWGAGAKGAASGAAMGAALGPWGAAAGGVIGGGLGLFSGGGDKPVPTQYKDYDQMQALIRGGMGDPNAAYWSQDVTHQQAPQLQMGADPFRQAQLQQLGQLQGIASGQQQGAGELAAQRQVQNALAAQQAQARMARGGNAALAYRNAANQSAALGSTGVGMGQQAALQDQMNAHGQLANVGAQGRAGDYSTANANAGYQAGTQQNNANNYMQLMSQLGQMNSAGLGVANATAREQNTQQNTQQNNFTGGLLNQAGQGVAAYMAQNRSAPAQAATTNVDRVPTGPDELYSDARLKTDVTDARSEVDKMLDGLKPVGWKYKDPKHGAGRWEGIIAQDLERSEAGKRIIVEAPDGKALDVNKAISAALASSARLNQRVRALEAK